MSNLFLYVARFCLQSGDLINLPNSQLAGHDNGLRRLPEDSP